MPRFMDIVEDLDVTDDDADNDDEDDADGVVIDVIDSITHDE